MKSRIRKSWVWALFGLALTGVAGPVQACGPGGMQGHGGHHHQMRHGNGHQGHADSQAPTGSGPGALPDADQPGARLLTGYCTQCHGLPHPGLHAEGEWPAVAGRMYQRMQQFQGRVDAPSPEEFGEILAYLTEHARSAD